MKQIARIGADPNDDDDLQLRKSLLVICALPFAVAGVAWGLMYVMFGEPLAGAIPLGYSVISLLSVVYFGAARKFRLFCFSQLALILLLPFFLMVTLGGFVNGSAVILWALICPLGALLFDDTRLAPRWFAVFVFLVVVSGLLQPYFRPDNNLPPGLVLIFFVINFLGVGSLVFFMVSYFVGQKNTFQERSEALLLNVLPREIVRILKREQRTIANQFDGASILFADMVNFTPMSAEMSPVEMVDLLNEIFSRFDTLVDLHNLEKIKTVGDCYMVAAGVPRPRPDHAQAIVRLALDMRAYLQSHTFKASRPVSFRMGINSGPVLAGVIGRRKFIYDLWGDAVNTASRMESHGTGGSIQITRATYELISDEFVCEPRGTVNVKGKGEMEVWFVTR
ncbi:MAG: adenylate/guanylate cyclase domain-containing protein [Thermoflexales bacterium]